MRTQNKLTKEVIKKMCIENSWHNQMSNNKGLDSYSNYIGESPGDMFVLIGRNRDSDILQESNFDAALEMLGGESDTVKVERFGHWGCGWFELILVDPKDKAKIKVACEVKLILENCHVLDESDFCERQSEAIHDYAEDTKEELAEALCIYFGLDGLENDKKMIDFAYRLQVECQHYAGLDSCINIYKFRDPELYDLERLESVIKQLKYTYVEEEVGPILEYFEAAFDLNQGEE